MLSIITACSRPANLKEIRDSIDFQFVHTWYIIYDTSRDRTYRHIFKDDPKIKEINYSKQGAAGHPQINYALDLIKDGFVYIIDDDNIVHPDLWQTYKTLDPDYIYTWDQSRPRQSMILKGNVIQKKKIDTSQFIVPRKYIGDIRWSVTRRGGDFLFISAIYKEHADKFKYIPKILAYHNYLKRCIAICFWGLMRSLKLTLPSIQKYIFKPLKDAKIEYDIFLHTYKVKEEYNNHWAGETNVKLDNDEYKLLEPTESIVEDKEKVSKKLDLEKFRKQGNPWDGWMKHKAISESEKIAPLNNHIFYLWSLKQVTSLWEKNEDKYTHILYCRPDVTYIMPLNPRWFTFSDVIYTPNFAKHGRTTMKISDRMALGQPEQMKIYGNRFDEALDYSKKRQLHSETFLAHIISKHKIKLKYVSIGFLRTRANGNIERDEDLKGVLRKKWLTRKQGTDLQKHYTRKVRKFGILNGE